MLTSLPIARHPLLPACLCIITEPPTRTRSSICYPVETRRTRPVRISAAGSDLFQSCYQTWKIQLDHRIHRVTVSFQVTGHRLCCWTLSHIPACRRCGYLVQIPRNAQKPADHNHIGCRLDDANLFRASSGYLDQGFLPCFGIPSLLILLDMWMQLVSVGADHGPTTFCWMAR